ncbi:hypothetical protein QTI51_22945 [Variovorax sp. J22G73]|uniref:hypothetical protein n=1 Tax=unclassified Variovorax TaxID=663243 RepID=UPI0025749DDE|nr:MULTISPECIES: hypothetical protein [unclassified Variovorax]MDM0007478.1 hypothetical protein [Variovorax sp. J22R203]MDM0100162.1 hypothetical protein [Variovorax sp. J22G73]
MSTVVNVGTAERRRRRQRQIVLSVILLGLLSLIFGVLFGGMDGVYTGPPDIPGKKMPLATLPILVGVCAIVVGGAFGMLVYLRPALADAVLSGIRYGVVGVSFYPAGTTEDTLKSLTKEVLELRGKAFQEKTTDVNAIAGLLLPSVQESILEKLQTKYSNESLDAGRLVEVRSVYISLENRLRLEIDSLGLRGNINLTIGVFTTLLAVSALAYMVFTSDRKFDSIVDVLSHYVPRLTLVVFIEVFSFFFLRLYRSTLDEIRFYQERLNDAATQRVAIELAWALGDSEARAAFANTLVTTKGRTEAKSTSSDEVDINALATVVAQLVKLMPAGSPGRQG